MTKSLKPYKIERMVALRDAYLPALQAAICKAPDDYMDTPETAPVTVAKMCATIHCRGIHAVNLGPALKAALKACGVKPTYKAAEAWLLGETP